MVISSPRRAALADLPALNGLARIAYAKYVPLIGREPQPMATDWAAVVETQEVWVIDDRDGGLAASLALEIEDRWVTIWSVAVRPDLQRQGIGRSLVGFAEARARLLGRHEIRLFTNERMRDNVAMYRRLGYAESHRERRPDRVLVHMAKQLD